MGNLKSLWEIWRAYGKFEEQNKVLESFTIIINYYINIIINLFYH